MLTKEQLDKREMDFVEMILLKHKARRELRERAEKKAKKGPLEKLFRR